MVDLNDRLLPAEYYFLFRTFEHCDFVFVSYFDIRISHLITQFIAHRAGRTFWGPPLEVVV